MINRDGGRNQRIVENIKAELRSKDGVTRRFNFVTRSRDA
jgi:hypothetical protein